MEFHTPTSLNNNVVGCNYTQERTQEIWWLVVLIERFGFLGFAFIHPKEMCDDVMGHFICFDSDRCCIFIFIIFCCFVLVIYLFFIWFGWVGI